MRYLALFVLFLFLLPAAVFAQSPQLADSLTSIGREYNDKGNYPQAEFYLSEAYRIYSSQQPPDTLKLINSALYYSEALHQRAKYAEVIELLESVHPLALSIKDTALTAEIQNYWGLSLKFQGVFSAAGEHYRKALELAEAAGDSKLVAIIYDNLGSLHRALGDFTEAIDYRKQALSLFERVGTDFNLAITLNNIGSTYIDLGMYDRALGYISESLELRKKIDNNVMLATGYGNIAMVQYHLGNYNQALAAYNRALDYARKAGSPLREAQTLINLGNLYITLGDSEKSLEYYRESLNIKLSNNISNPRELAGNYKNIATRQFELGQVEEAYKNYRKALELRKQTGNPRELALSYLDMAKVETENNNFTSAMQYAARSRHIADSLRINDLVIDSHIRLGTINSNMKKLREALQHYRIAHQHSMELSQNHQFSPLRYLSHAFDRVQSDSAVYYGQQLVDLLEASREKVGEISALKSGFFEKYSDFYVNLASWYLKYRDDTKHAYELVEASKARVLIDELAIASQNLDAALPESTRIEKQNKLELIDDYYQQLSESQTPSERDRLNRELRKAELEYAAFMSRVRSENPSYKEFTYPAPATLGDAQSMIDDETAVLEFAFTDTELLVFLITSDEARVKRIDIAEGTGDQQAVTELVEVFRDDILAHATIEQLASDSAPLFRYVIEPFYGELAAYENLIVIPDGALTYLPFESLIHQNRFLVEEFNIKYIPSLTTFSLLNEPKSSYETDLLAVAGSNFGGTSGLVNRNRSYEPLPATLAEVDSIASKFQKVSLHKEGNLSETFIKDKLKSNVRFIHLATHGIINDDYPSLSGLVLSASDESELSSTDDGMLRSSEIYQLNMNSDMVVLSACNTGLGKVVKGEGMLGLQRSFFYAGVPTVTVSLWNVYDRSTAYMMNEFYTALLDKTRQNDSESWWDSFLRWIGWSDHVPYGNTASAMRQAKLNMIQHPLYRHPVYWAPFVVVGR